MTDLFSRFRQKFFPGSFFLQYEIKARYRKFSRAFFILSFDCDTREDAGVVLSVHRRLKTIGALPLYAVPGELLRQDADIYRQVQREGGIFLNHGGRSHTFFNEAKGRHESCFFYDQQDFDILKQDIAEGEKALLEVLEIHPTGFRVPHFGTFQKPQHLTFLHSTLSEMGYRWSSSTMPEQAYLFGPAYPSGGVHEFPVTGSATQPLTNLDSWGHFADPNRKGSPQAYLKEAAALTELVKIGIFNLYADPSHIAKSEEFFQAVEKWVKAAEPTDYDTLLDRMEKGDI